MTTAEISGILLNIGAISAIAGIGWFSWDYNARGPGWLLGIGIVALIIGKATS